MHILSVCKYTTKTRHDKIPSVYYQVSRLFNNDQYTICQRPLRKKKCKKTLSTFLSGCKDTNISVQTFLNFRQLTSTFQYLRKKYITPS